MKEYPSEIYLQVVPEDSEYYEPGTITWCEDRINASDKKYIAEDVVQRMIERFRRLALDAYYETEEYEEPDVRIRNIQWSEITTGQ